MKIVLKESVSHLLLLLPTKLHFFPRSGSYLPAYLSLSERNKSLHSHRFPGSHHVGQAVQEFRNLSAANSLAPGSTVIEGVHHHAQLKIQLF